MKDKSTTIAGETVIIVCRDEVLARQVHHEGNESDFETKVQGCQISCCGCACSLAAGAETRLLRADYRVPSFRLLRKGTFI